MRHAFFSLQRLLLFLLLLHSFLYNNASSAECSLAFFISSSVCLSHLYCSKEWKIEIQSDKERKRDYLVNRLFQRMWMKSNLFLFYDENYFFYFDFDCFCICCVNIAGFYCWIFMPMLYLCCCFVVCPAVFGVWFKIWNLVFLYWIVVQVLDKTLPGLILTFETHSFSLNFEMCIHSPIPGIGQSNIHTHTQIQCIW